MAQIGTSSKRRFSRPSKNLGWLGSGIGNGSYPRILKDQNWKVTGVSLVSKIIAVELLSLRQCSTLVDIKHLKKISHTSLIQQQNHAASATDQNNTIPRSSGNVPHHDRCRKALVSMCFQSTHAVLRAQRKRMSYRLPVSAAILLQRIRYSFPSLVGLTSCSVLVCIGRIDKHELLSADTASKTFGGKTSNMRWQTHCNGSHDSYPAETMPFWLFNTKLSWNIFGYLLICSTLLPSSVCLDDLRVFGLNGFRKCWLPSMTHVDWQATVNGTLAASSCVMCPLPSKSKVSKMVCSSGRAALILSSKRWNIVEQITKIPSICKTYTIGT